MKAVCSLIMFFCKGFLQAAYQSASELLSEVLEAKWTAGDMEMERKCTLSCVAYSVIAAKYE